MNRTFAFCALPVSSDDVRDVLEEDPRALTAFAFCALRVLLLSCGAFALSSGDVRDVLAERLATLLLSEST